MRRFIILLSLVALILFSACVESDNKANNGNVNDDKPTIAMTVINQEALFFTEMLKGAEEAVDKDEFNFIKFDANNKEVDQYNAIENFISEGVDAIIINAVDRDTLIPLVEEADEEGIIIISVDSVIEHDTVDVQIGVDNSESSKDLAEYFNNYVKDNHPEGSPKLGVVGALNAAVQVIRQDSFLDEVEKGSDVELINIVDSQNVQEKALTAAEDLLLADIDLDYVYVTGEPAFIGSVSAVSSQGFEDDVKLFGWDLSPQVIEGIDEGFVEAVLQQHPDKYGEEAVKAAIKLINGEEVDDLIDIPATIVTEENIDEFRPLFE